MRRRVLAMSVCISLLLLSVLLLGFAPGDPGLTPEPGRILVKVRPGASIGRIVSRHQADSGSVRRMLDVEDPEVARWFVVPVTSGSERSTALEYSCDPAVEVAEPVWPRKPLWVPNDPELQRQWGLTAIGAFDGWDVRRSSVATVAVVDSGVDADHEDLASALAPGRDFLGKGGTNDLMGHGTHVAGIIGALTDNSVGVAGSAPGAAIVPIRVFDARGRMPRGFALGDAIVAAQQSGARVVNMSLGGPGYSQAEQDTIDWAHTQGMVLVASAGNEADRKKDANAVMYPAACENVIAVGATQADGTRAPYSNYGPYVDVVAPGGYMAYGRDGGIFSTTPNHRFGLQSWGYTRDYSYMSGTSMSAPFVSGLAALLLSEDPSLTPDGVETIIEQTAADLGPTGPDVEYGAGLIQVDKALARAAAAPPAGG